MRLGMLQKVLFVVGLCYGLFGYCGNNPNKDIDIVLTQWVDEIKEIKFSYEKLNTPLLKRLQKNKSRLWNTNDSEEQLRLLIEAKKLEDQLSYNYRMEATDLSKIRYIKGLQIIKILYEKSLSLDHHFASVATFNEINNLSNPNHYPEFLELKGDLSSKQNKKTGFNLTSILGNNIYTSVVHSFVSLFSNDNTSRAKKEADLKDVECILDFTLRMHNDLNTIYFETAFLQKSNDGILKELEQLFADFAKPISYKTALKECRNSDDWDTVKEKLNAFMDELTKFANDESLKYKAHKMRINLEFSIDRLLNFIAVYNAHIDQGTKFYEKFRIMLNSYENEQQCATKIPPEYAKLKENITITIEKFNTAYRPVEINGSKMKEILYGINEYE
ncbi:hypothetical protein [Winogradskyella sp.]|jgi:hypothetical protein|uniref:hypothetical protein n=1 Tax=Winogradskyella sp. TaxID=1883156 RepID=UPI0025F48048|nr:hypothetical protein [Winogradskyella sp.]MCT4629575.1 hypothetical protein [Winogradskyella sp.]